MSLKPGFHFKYPWPVEKVIKEKTQEIRQIQIGNISSGKSFALLWAKEHGTGEPFLSGDNNYFHPYLILHYRIKNLFNYIFLNKDSEEVLNHVTHQVITQIFATQTFYDIATKLRSRLINQIHEEVQKKIDFFQSLGFFETAQQKLGDMINSQFGSVLGDYRLNQMINTEPEQVKLSEIERRILENSNRNAKGKYGLEVLQLGVRRINYPSIVARAVFSRMQSEREK